MAVDSAGNLYIADTWNHRIRKVDSTGTITTVAGTGEFGFSGDEGPATTARLAFPYGVAVDSAGSLYIADTGNRRIRKLTPGGGSTPPNPTAVLNAASFTPGAAPGSLQSLFGERLALETAAASELPLPEALGGVRIEIIDSTEAAHAVQLLYVSPGQINFLTPSETTPGAAVLRLTREGEEPVESALTISVAAPGLFSANGTGEGIGAITALRVAADGSRSTPAVFRFDRGFMARMMALCSLPRSKLKLSQWAEKYEQGQGEIRCPARVRNNARRGQGKRVQDRVSRPTGRHRREEMSPQQQERQAKIPAGRDGQGGPDRGAGGLAAGRGALGVGAASEAAWQCARETGETEQAGVVGALRASPAAAGILGERLPRGAGALQAMAGAGGGHGGISGKTPGFRSVATRTPKP